MIVLLNMMAILYVYNLSKPAIFSGPALTSAAVALQVRWVAHPRLDKRCLAGVDGRLGMKLWPFGPHFFVFFFATKMRFSRISSDFGVQELMFEY